jgi:guanosine-3',5'-bis(diphosphate) 3'-pyrophosphohydrolase
MDLVLKATAFAAHKHRNQRRKNAEKTPYINHPIRVAQVLTVVGVDDPVVLAAALLHDTIEDTDTSYDEVVAEFGVEVADVVKEVTDNKSLPKAERKRLQVENAPHKSTRAKLVKLADKFDNLSDLSQEAPQGWSDEIVRGYFVWSSKVVDGLRGTNSHLESQLDRIFATMIPADLDRDVALQNYYNQL